MAMKIAAKHPDMAGIGIMLKEAVGLGLATPPGLSGFAGSRPALRLSCGCFPARCPRHRCRCGFCWAMKQWTAMKRTARRWIATAISRPAIPIANTTGTMVEVPLIALAWARSGDKGNNANVGVIARNRSTCRISAPR